MKWTEKDIKNLRKHAHKVFKTEIPLSGEIEKIKMFLDQSEFEFRKDNPKLVKTTNVGIRWFPNFWEAQMEIDIPTDVLEIVRSQCVDLLSKKCDELASLCGYMREDI